MLRILPLFVTLFTVFSGGLSAQNSGDNIFDPSVLHEVNLIFAEPNYWEILTDNAGGRIPNPRRDSIYLMASVVIDGEMIDSVGIRIKGYSSAFERTKKPLKIDFNEFVPEKRYDGLRKINLNNGAGDPGFQRETMGYDLMNRMGVDAPRTSYTRLSINGEFFAVYQLVEQVDKEFLKNNFNNASGNLFKANGDPSYEGYEFDYNGTDPEAYKDDIDLKTNEVEGDYSAMIRFLDVLNNTPDEEFPEAIQEVFNVDRFLKTLAVDVAIDNWDSHFFWRSGWNWYMYEDPSTGKLQWIPWDYNYAFGSKSYLLTEADCDGYSDVIYFSDGTPTVQLYLEIFRVSLRPYIRWNLGPNGTFNEYSLENGQRITLTCPDTGRHYGTVAYGPGDMGCGDLVDYVVTTEDRFSGLPVVLNGDLPNDPDLAFAVLLFRHRNLGCGEIWSENCARRYAAIQTEVAVPGSGFRGENFPVDIRQLDDVGVDAGKLMRKILNTPVFYERYLNHFCNLLENIFLSEHYNGLIDENRELLLEAISNSLVKIPVAAEFEWELSPAGMPKYLSDRIAYLKAQLQDMDVACNNEPAEGIPFGAVVINEFVADNDSTSTISDPDGGYPDWIELYNTTDARIDLSGAYLSDKADNLVKWEFPDGASISANDYLIIWADEDENEDGLHVNFKLSKNGEAIYLSNAGDSSRIDSIVFDVQETNVSMSRVPNGSGDFVAQHPTHGFNNDALAPNISMMDVVINEFVANSDTTGGRSVEACCASDWIELYNNTGADIDLSGACLSNTLEDIVKWNFPEGTRIIADSSLIVWADGGEAGEGLHANFVLDENGGAIYLSNTVDSTRIDEVTFGVQDAASSMSRVPNGTGDFIVQHVTRGYSNDTPVGNRNVANKISLSVYPNPVEGVLNVRFPNETYVSGLARQRIGSMQIDLYTITGRKVLVSIKVTAGTLELDVKGLAPGIYLLSVRGERGESGTVRFVKR